MRTTSLFIAMLLLIVLRPLMGQTNDPTTQRKQPGELPILPGYFGGLPFYTAFHQSLTTRLLLLKAADDSPELRKHLRLSDRQLKAIDQIEIGDNGRLSDEARSKLLDENIAVDEDVMDPDFYSFLDDTQRESLDRLALEFDGCAGLSRLSVANRLKLSSDTRQAIASTIVEMREHVYLPYFRYRFVAKLPTDHEYRKCVFVGEFLVSMNREILTHLSDKERESYTAWVSRTQPPSAVIEAIKQKAPLPEGLFGLAGDG
jgi:hypothetical protein